MLNGKKKQSIIDQFKTHAKDTGSSEVQIAILTEEIRELTRHLRKHKHDFSSRRGLLKKLGERRRLMRYLEIDNQESYAKLIKALGLRPLKRLAKEEEIKKILEDEVPVDEAVATL
ncbi:MAG: 30S ribosomal protein S15 [Parcubacteria group bacterium]